LPLRQSAPNNYQSGGVHPIIDVLKDGGFCLPPRGPTLPPDKFSLQGFEEDDAMPDIESNLSKYRLLNWDMEPGDCLVHHGLTVHGAGGNTSLDIRRRALATRWAGDDATYRAGGGDQPLQVEGLRAGDPLPPDRFPFVVS
jgi:ectoine hydroxylase-related dioxygenase (phytanoyl-CoA dioxygenase family)